MNKITVKNVSEIIQKVQRRSFLTNPIFLVQNCSYEEKNGDLIIYWTENELLFPCLRAENMVNKKISCFKSDIQRLKSLGLEIKKIEPEYTEYFYKTSDYIELTGSAFKKIRKEINYFQNNYDYTLTNKYAPAEIKKFLAAWYKNNAPKKSGHNRETFDYEYESCLKAIDILDDIPAAKAMFVKIKNELAGFSIFTEIYPDFWVGVFQKVDHKFEGIGKILYHERAILMAGREFFSNGDDAADPALTRYKKSLNPVRTEESFTVTTGDKR